MRAGEILSLTWPNVHLSEHYVHLPNTKTVTRETYCLACEILVTLHLGPWSRLLAQFCRGRCHVPRRKVRDSTGNRGVHFHDSCAEAIWRLSKKWDILQLARFIVPRALKSLMICYHEPTSEITRQLS